MIVVRVLCNSLSEYFYTFCMLNNCGSTLERALFLHSKTIRQEMQHTPSHLEKIYSPITLLGRLT